ncbi:MAG: TIGR01777 family oxidoreductase [Sphingobacteriaceae bacterium]
MANKTIVISGGTGLIGQRLCKALLDKGHTVRILSRSATPNIDKRITAYTWNVDKNELDARCFEGADVVIHLAGEAIVDKPWTSARKKAIIESRTASIRLIYSALKNSKNNSVKTLISAAAIGFYSDRGDEILNESSPAGTGFLAESCIAWEQAIDEGEVLGLRIVKFRTGIVLDKEGGALPPMALPVKLGLGASLGSGKQWISWIHWQDVVNMYVFALEQGTLKGVYNMAAPEPITNKAFTQALAKQFKRPLWLPGVPSILLKAILGERSVAILGSTRVQVAKIQEAGFSFLYPSISSALKELYD